MSGIAGPSVREAEMSQSIRAAVLAEIERKHLSEEHLSSALGLLPLGVQFLLAEKEWPLETAVRVADALGIRVEMTTGIG